MIGIGRRNFGGSATGVIEPPDFMSSPVMLTAPTTSDPGIPLLNLSLLGKKMDSLRFFLSDSIDRRVSISGDQLQFVSNEIASVVHQVIINGSALLLASTRHSDGVKPLQLPSKVDADPSDNTAQLPPPPLRSSAVAESDGQIVEIDAAELMAEHVHFCEICGKGFRRDANLRMHMRAHGDRFKTLESLTKPDGRISSEAICPGRKVRFSCPFLGCRRNQSHPRFRPLKTTVCVRNHFRRSHCPKLYTCDLCNKKSFSVVADLKSHRKSCGESQWRCTCGTSFSRKDKLFGHVTLFDGHFPVVGAVEEEKGESMVKGGEIKDERGGQAGGSVDEEFFSGLMEEIGVMGGGWMRP
ncbi:protein SENSITIVE TO PROTON RHIZOTOXICITY 1-like [Phalaenopsis equestris]|uniref:protein SENSITIVE TO PROTON RHIZOTOXICITY 1-like n=1 Tax=Phalaenopsis equestris TaxID=78828 RepID=UPI0009E18C92|nr:protein SENSITIVE TO PROTON RHIZOTOXICITY 1-like [Phalaenopsis equestris]